MINPLVFITILGGVLDALALQVTDVLHRASVPASWLAPRLVGRGVFQWRRGLV